jgi:copper chaperone
MKTYTFKTSINCDGCIAKVTPFINNDLKDIKWSVETQNPNKILTVETDLYSEKEIMDVVKKAGFKIEMGCN